MEAGKQPKNIPKSRRYFARSFFSFEEYSIEEQCVHKIESLLGFIRDELSSQDFLVPTSGYNKYYTLIKIVGTNYGVYILCKPEDNPPTRGDYLCFTTAIYLFDKKIFIEKPSWGYADIDLFFEPEKVVKELKKIRELALSPPRYPCKPDYDAFFQKFERKDNELPEEDSDNDDKLPEHFDSDNDDELPSYYKFEVSKELYNFFPITDFPSKEDEPEPYLNTIKDM